jgi:putative flippase GtrA
MAQQIAINWTVFGWSLAGIFLFGILYAVTVRLASKRRLMGQTAWAVVIGVSATLLAMIPTFGLERVAMMFCFFVASGVPMIIEYLLRVQDEIQQDQEEAQDLAKDLLK